MAGYGTCSRCGGYRPVIGEASPVCYSCLHTAAGVPKVRDKGGRPVLERDAVRAVFEQTEAEGIRRRIRALFSQLAGAWDACDAGKEEEISWELIDALEDLLGKD